MRRVRGLSNATKRLRGFGLALTAMLASAGLALVGFSGAQSAADGSDSTIDYSLRFTNLGVSGTGLLIPRQLQFSVDFWVKPESDAEDGIFAQGAASGDRYYLERNADKSISLFSYLGGTLTTQPGTVPTDAWTHVAITHTSTKTTIYINAQEVVSTGPLTGTGWSTRFGLGERWDGGVDFSGQIDQFKVWSSGGLSESDIQASMHSIGTGGVTSASLIRHYSFNEPSGATFYDLSSNGVNLVGNREPERIDVKQVSSASNGDTVIAFPRTYLPGKGGWTVPANATNFTALVVAGGGGGGGDEGGGGGAGGLTESALAPVASSTLSVVVGMGGFGADHFNKAASNGQDSALGGLSVTGGGAGGNSINTAGDPERDGQDGGSGGGAAGENIVGGVAGSGISGQGHDGSAGVSAVGNGGGGAGSAASGANGGAGRAVNIITTTLAGEFGVGEISGSSVYFAGGGGGGGGNSSNTAGTGGLGGGSNGNGSSTPTAEAVPNTGGGGGGGGGNYNQGTWNNPYSGKSGASGVVIVRYSPATDQSWKKSNTVDGNYAFNYSPSDPVMPVSPTAAWTFETWIYPTSFNPTWTPLFSQQVDQDQNTPNPWARNAIWLSNGEVVLVTPSSDTFTGYVLPVGRWVHIAWAQSTGTAASLYVDGVQVWNSNLVSRTGNSGTYFAVGGSRQTAHPEFHGEIDQVKIWGTQLSSTQVAASMHAHSTWVGAPASSCTSGLRALYDFNEYSETQVLDRSGCGRHLEFNTAVSGNYLSTDLTSSGIINTGAAHTEQSYVKFNRSYLTATGGWTPPAGVDNFKAVVVGGGGGGGAWVGGGGGAGGYSETTSLELTASAIPIVVGQGGQGAVFTGATYQVNGVTRTSTNGQDSKIGDLVQLSGGGRGASHWNTDNNLITLAEAIATSGGSGGGGSGYNSAGAPYNALSNTLGGSGVAGQGTSGGSGVSGGWQAAGGGGAGSAGANGITGKAGDGGVGTTTYLTGSSGLQLAGGGGGANHDDQSASVQGAGTFGGGTGGRYGAAALTNSGGGGGGGAYPSGSGNSSSGGSGGSGVIILSWGPYLEVSQSPTVARAGDVFRDAIKLQVMDESTGQPFLTSYPVTVTASANVLTLNGVLLTQSYTVQSSAVDGTVDFSGLGFASNVSGPVTLTFTSDQFVGTSLVVSPNYFPQNVEIVASGTTGGTFLEGEFFANSGTGTTIVNKDDLVAHLASYSTVVSASGFISVQTSFNSQTSSDIVLRAAGYVEATAGSSIRTHGGDIVLWADSDDVDGGFIRLLGSTTLCTTSGDCATTVNGGGDIVLGGGLPSANNPLRPSGPAKGSGNDGAGTDATSTGVQLGTLESGNTGSKLYSAGGNIEILGRKALNTSVWSAGIAFLGGTDIRSGNGTIYIFGESTEDGSSTDGTMEFNAWGGATGGSVYIESRNTSSEAIVIEGKETGTATSNGMWGSNDNTTIASSGSLTIRADHVNSSLDLEIDVAGELIIEPYSSGLRQAQTGTVFDFTIGSSSDDFNLLRNPAGIRVGSASNSNRINLPSSFTSAGDIEVLGSQIEIGSNQNITSTAEGSRILMKATDWIDFKNGSSSSTFGKLQTNNGDIILWSDADNSGAGSIYIGPFNEINSANGLKNKTGAGGGRITVAGSFGDAGIDADGHPLGSTADSGNVNGSAGGTLALELQNDSKIFSGGGDVTIRAKSDRAATTMWADVDQLIYSGDGKISVSAVNTGSELPLLMEGNWYSNHSQSPAIELTASSNRTSGEAIQSNANPFEIVSLATSGGGISISAQVGATNTNGILWNPGWLLSQAGSINVYTNARLDWNDSGQRAIGGRASTDVVSSSADVLIQANAFLDSTANTGSTISTSGAVTISPTTTHFDSDSEVQFTVDAGSFAFGSVDGVNSATKKVKLSRDITAAGPINIAGMGITVDRGVDLISTANGAPILLKSKGWVDIDNLTSTLAQTNDSDFSIIQSNQGDIILWADSDADQQGLIWIAHNTRINSYNGVYSYDAVSGGGDIIFAGGADDGSGRPVGSAWDYGYRSEDGPFSDVAVGFGKFVDVFSGGGDIIVRASKKNSGGLSAFHFQSLGEYVSGTGRIIIEATVTSSGSVEAFEYWTTAETEAGGLFSSHSTAEPAISISASIAGTAIQPIRIYNQNQSNPTTFQSLSSTGGGLAFASMMGTTSTEIGTYLAAVNLLSKTGTITFSSNAVLSVANAGWNQFWGERSGTSVSDSVAPITIRANGIHGTALTVTMSTSAAVQVLPFGSNFGTDVAWSPKTFAGGGFTLGVDSAWDSAIHAVNIYQDIISSGAIEIFGEEIILPTAGSDLVSGGLGDKIVLKSKTFIENTNGTSDNFSLIQSNNGDIVLWPNATDGGSGNLFLGNYTQVNSANGVESKTASGGGRITMAGGSSVDGEGHPTGSFPGRSGRYALFLEDYSEIYSGGGDVYINVDSNIGNVAALFEANSLIWSGTGQIKAKVASSATHASRLHMTWISAATLSPAIEYRASVTNNWYAMYNDSGQTFTMASIASTGGGISTSALTPSAGNTAHFLYGWAIESRAGDISFYTNGISNLNSSQARYFGATPSGEVASSSADIYITSQNIPESTGNTASKVSTSGLVSIQPAGTTFTANTRFRFDIEAGSLKIGDSSQMASYTNTFTLDRPALIRDSLEVYANSVTVLSGADITGTGSESSVTLSSKATTTLNAVVAANRSIVLRGAALDFTAATVTGSAAVTLESQATSFQTMPSLANLTLGTDLSGFTYGRATEGGVSTIAKALIIKGPITVYGGTIAAQQDMVVTSTSAAITLKSTGNISTATNVDLRTRGGDIILWSDSDNSGEGAIAVGSTNTICSGWDPVANTCTLGQGGDVVLGGGLADVNDATRPGGLAQGSGTSAPHSVGVALGACVTNATGVSNTIVTRGGSLSVRGAGTAGSLASGTLASGVVACAGNDVNVGVGKILIESEYRASNSSYKHGVWFSPWLSTPANSSVIFRSENSDDDAVKIIGRGGEQDFVSFGLTVLNSQGGGAILEVGSLHPSAPHLNFDSHGSLEVRPASHSFTAPLSVTANFGISTSAKAFILGSASNTESVSIQAAKSIDGDVTILAGGLENNGNLIVTGAGSKIRAVVDTIALTGNLQATNSGVLEILPRTVGRSITLGAEQAGTLSIENAEAGRLIGTYVRIGSQTSGGITLAGNTNFTKATNVKLTTPGSVSRTNNAILTAANLAIDAGGGVSLPGANSVSGNVAISASSSAQYASAVSYSPATVDGVLPLFGIGVAVSQTNSPAVQNRNAFLAVTFNPPPQFVVTDTYSNTLDSNNRLAASYTVSATVVQGTGTVAGLTASFSANAYSFNSLRVDTDPGTYSFTITVDDGIAPFTTSSVDYNVQSGDPQQLIVTATDSTAPSGQASFSFAVAVQDQGGNAIVAGANANITVSASVSGAVLVSGGQVRADNSGVATFTDLVVTGSVSSQISISFFVEFTANNNVFTTVSSEVSALTLTPGTATQLRIDDASQSVANRSTLSALVVDLLDAQGNLVYDRTDEITVSIGSGSGATLVGTTSLNFTAGVSSLAQATFNNLALQGTVGSYRLDFESDKAGISSVSHDVTLTHGAPSQLAITQGAAQIRSGIQIVTQPRVALRDLDGNLVPSEASISATVTGATLSGTTTVEMVDGLATFSDLVLTGTAGSYTLGYSVSAPVGLAGFSISEQVSIAAGEATKLKVSQQPQNVVAGVAQAVSVSVQVMDAQDNLTTVNSNTTINLVLQNYGAGAADVETTSPVVLSAGQSTYTYSNLVLTKAGQTMRLVFTASGLVDAASDFFSIAAAAPDNLQWVTNVSDATNDVAMNPAPTVRVFDEFGNAVVTQSAQTNISVSVIVGGANVLDLSGGTAQTDGSSSLVSLNNLVLRAKVGSYQIRITAENPGQPIDGFTLDSEMFNLGFGAATSLTTSPSALSVVNRATLTDITVSVLDSAGNLVADNTQAITPTVSGIALSGSALNAVGGQATFSSLVLTGLVGNYDLGFTATSVLGATTSVSVTHAAAYAISLSAPAAVKNAMTASEIVAKILDQDGNLVTTGSQSTQTVELTVSAAVLSGDIAVSASAGIATFSNVAITGSVSNKVITATIAAPTEITESQTVTLGFGDPYSLDLTQAADGFANREVFVTAPEVTVRDVSGNVVQATGMDIRVTVATASISGSITASAASGVAQFASDLVVRGLAGSHTLVFTAEGVSSSDVVVASQTFTLNHGAASQLVVTESPAGILSGIDFETQPSLELRDPEGNRVSTSAQATGQVIVSYSGNDWTNTRQGVDLSGTTTITLTGGQGQFTNLRLSGKAGNYTIKYTYQTDTFISVSEVVSVEPGTETKLAILQQPQNIVAGEAFAQDVAVEILDAYDNRVQRLTQSATVRAKLIEADDSTLITYSDAVGATQGVVSFSGLTFVSQGDRKIVFEKDPGSSTPALTSVTSTQFTITHAAASTLSWIVEPQVTVMNDAVIAGVGAASPSFRAFDEFGNVIDTGVVKLSVVSVGGNTPISISGNSVDGVNGTVTIPQLKLRALVGDYDLEFRAFTDTNASTFATLSHQIEVLHGVPTQLTTSAHATAARAGIDLTPQPQLRILDSAGNLVSNSSLVVYAAADGATLVGTNQLAATDGVSSFTGLSLTGSASSAVTLSYEISYQSSSISTSIVIPLLAGDAATASLSWTVTDVQTRVAPQNTPLVELFDVFGNKVLSDSSSTATAKLFKNGSLVTQSATTFVASSGEIEFNSLALKATPGSNYFYQFEVAGLTPVSSSQFVMLPGPVAKVHIHQQPSTIVNGITTTMTGETFEQFAIVHLLDQDDNIVTTVNSGDVTTAISTGSGGSLISASASISNGVATFTNLKLIGVVETPEQSAEDYKLTFSYGGFDSAESDVLRVKHNLASSLSLEVAAANGRSGIAFTQQAVVKLRDRYNNWVSTGQSVTITGELVGASAPAATLGSISVPTVNGVSTLSVTITGPVENSYTIRYLADNNQGVPISYVEQSGITITHGTHDKVRIIRNVASLDQNNGLTMIGEAFHIQPIIEVLDSANNRVLDYNGLIVASISSTVRGDRDYLTGYTVSAVAGVATFSDLAMVGQVFTDYQITFNRENRSGGSAVSTSFQLTHGLAEYLTIETQPQGGNKTGSALSVSPVIAVRDFDGNIATTLNGPSVSAAILTGGGTVDTTGSNTEKALVENGIAAFSNLTVVALPGQDQTLGFTLDGALNSASAAVTSTQSATFSLIVADAYKLSVFTEPCTAADCSAGPTAELLGIQPVVEIQDRFGNRVPGFTGEVTATLQGTVGSLRDDDGQISSRSVTVVNGLATFTDLRIEGVPGNNYRLQFAATGLVSTTSQDVQVMHTTPSQVVFTQQPVGGITGELLAGQPVLEVRDRFGNKAVTDNSTQVTVSVLSGPLRVNGQAAEISGSLTVTAVNGTVTFSELELIGKTNENYVLRFAAAGYFVDSQPVVVSPAGANVLEWIVEPIAQRTGEAMGTQPVLRMLDFDGNLASSTAATVTVTVSSGGGYIEAGTTSAAVDGVITFSGLTLVAAPNAPQTLTFTATTAGGAFSINTTAPLRVEHTDASQMVIDSTYAALSEQGRVLGTQPVIKLYDRFGNPAVNDNSTVVTATIGSGAGGAVSGSATATAVAGVVTFAGLAVTGSPGVVYTLDFSAGGYGVAGTSNLQLFKTAELEVSYSNIVYSSSPTTTPAIAFTDSTEHSISFTVSTPQFCTIDQNTGEVTIVSAGTCVISATVLAGPFYKFISKDVNLVIQKAEQSTVVFSNSAEVVFGQLLTLVAKGGESTEEIEISARGCTLLGDKLSTIGNATEGGASTCRVFAFRPGDQNYEDSNVARLDVIVKRAAQAPISIGNPRNVTVGNVELFILGGSGAGTVSYEVQLGTNTAQCSIANGVLSASKNGSCEVVASKAQDINFNVATSPAAVFTFTKQLQSVTITSAPPPMPLPGTSYLVNATASGATTISFAVTKGQEIQATQLVSASTAVCQLSQSVSGQVTFLRSGECEITATAASSDRFASATAKISILVGQLNQFITFNPLPDLTYGAPAFRLTAVASSGLPVSYTVSAGVSVCSISNGMVTINAAGTCEIRASQAGNGSYAPAPNVIRSFQVNPGQASSPALVSAAVGNQWFTVGFTAPSYNGGSEIFAYRLEVRDQNGNLYVSTSTNTQSPLSITAAGIPNDTPYTAKVAAITSAGIGQFSNTTVSLTPSDAAMSVTQLTAETSVSGLELSWVTPEALEGNFLRYEVYAWVTGTEEPLTPTTTITNSASDQVTIATSSISNEISISPASYVAPRLQIVQPLYRPNAGIYQFGVARTAPVGFFTLASIAQPATESAAVGYTMRVVTITDTYSSSQVINTANGVKVGLSAPSAPTQFNIDSSDPSKLTITWAAPNSDGGFPLIDYQVTSNGQVICANIQTRLCEITPLTDSTTYDIEVKARNALGLGDAAGGSHTTPTPPPVVSLNANESLQLALGRAPLMTQFSPKIARPGSIVSITGERLALVQSLALGDRPVEYTILGDRSASLRVPIDMPEGLYAIIHTSEFGKVTVMDALIVAGAPIEQVQTPTLSPETDKPVIPEATPSAKPTPSPRPSTGPDTQEPSQPSEPVEGEGSTEQTKPEPQPTAPESPGSETDGQGNTPSAPPAPEDSNSEAVALPSSGQGESIISLWFLIALLLVAAMVGGWPILAGLKRRND